MVNDEWARLFSDVCSACEINVPEDVSIFGVDNGKIAATIEIPKRNPLKSVMVRFRHPQAKPIQSVTVNGKPWSHFTQTKKPSN